MRVISYEELNSAIASIPDPTQRELVQEHVWGADLDSCIVIQVREAAQRVTGGNCMFADDDLRILEHLAIRARRAGYVNQLHPDIANRAMALNEGSRGMANQFTDILDRVHAKETAAKEPASWMLTQRHNDQIAENAICPDQKNAS